MYPMTTCLEIGSYPKFALFGWSQPIIFPSTIVFATQAPLKLKYPPLAAAWQSNIFAASLGVVLYAQPLGGSTNLNKELSSVHAIYAVYGLPVELTLDDHFLY
jgi:hypothetical protein